MSKKQTNGGGGIRTMNNSRAMAWMTALAMGWGLVAAQAGSLDSLAAPTSADSAMYTLEDIYQRLSTGASRTKRTGGFVEPGEPGSTMHTINEIMAKAPLKDEVNGATACHVMAGKKFWGLTSESWGVQTGTMETRTLSETDGTVQEGYYAATTLNAVDPDLKAGNIKQGTVLFGITGAVPYGGGGALAPVARTGQTNSYAAGDDGALQKGVAWPSTRFTDNGNGTVTDNLTGLIWLKRVTAFWKLAWTNALSSCATLNSGEQGLTDGSQEGDWRLPNVMELRSLIKAGAYAPALQSSPFTDIQYSDTSHYWSSTTYAGGTANAYRVTLSVGQVATSAKTATWFAWPVRDGL